MTTLRRSKIIQWEKGAQPERVGDEFALEEPLEIRIDNHPVSVTMRTPGHDDELAVGFLVSEGLIRNRESILKIQTYARNPHQNVLNVFLAPNVAVDFTQLTRHVFASSSCGLCGKTTIEAVHRQFPPIEGRLSIEAPLLLQLPGKLRAAQPAFARTGGLHGAALFDAAGGLIIAREDVGRHNAVDKVLGYGALNGLLPFDRHILLVSGRASFEIVQKALSARIPAVAAVSAPSSLAVEFARQSRQVLVGFLRGKRLNVYSMAKRVKFVEATPLFSRGHRRPSPQSRTHGD